jgi:hypothetical protein
MLTDVRTNTGSRMLFVIVLAFIGIVAGIGAISRIFMIGDIYTLDVKVKR